MQTPSPGSHVSNVDGKAMPPTIQLSRCSVSATAILESVPQATEGNIREAQLADNTLRLLLRRKELGTRPTIAELGDTSPSTRRLLQLWEQLSPVPTIRVIGWHYRNPSGGHPTKVAERGAVWVTRGSIWWPFWDGENTRETEGEVLLAWTL